MAQDRPPDLSLHKISLPTHKTKLFLPFKLSLGLISASGELLVDSGADSNFMSEHFAKTYDIPMLPLDLPMTLELADGSSSSKVTKVTPPMQMELGGHVETITFFITKTPNKIILGHLWLRTHNPQIDWYSHSVTFSSQCVPNCCSEETTVYGSSDLVESTSAVQLQSLKEQVFPFIDTSVDSPKLENPDLSDLILEFSDIFNEDALDTAFQHARILDRPFECDIPLQPGKHPPFGPLYQLTETENKTMKDYIDTNLKRGWIEHSSSPAGAPCFFIKKKDGSLRLCVDYRGLNAITIKNRYALPLINDLINQLSKAKIYSALDLKDAYHLVKIKSGEEWKTAFRTHYGHFQYKVMPFGLTNAPAIFQGLMQEIFRNEIGKFVVVYLDDILVFSDNAQEHSAHLRVVFSKLREYKLFCKRTKCQFGVTEISYLGYVISPRGTFMDKSKVSSILDWKPPQNVPELQSFLGFANFYRRFIPNYAALTKPMTSLLKKNVVFSWTSDHQKAFESLKQSFASPPILVHPNSSLPYCVETDASDFAIAGILSQVQPNSSMHPVAFFSRQMTPAELNYPVYDKELLAIYTCFKEWRHFLQGAKHRVTVFCDHRNLVWFTTSKQLSQRQARWGLFFTDFDFVITYRPGPRNRQADALSRKGEYSTSAKSHNFTVLLKDRLQLQALAIGGTSEFMDMVAEDTKHANSDGTLTSDPLLQERDGLFYRDNRLYLPSTRTRLLAMKQRHDNPAAGHFGKRKTKELLALDFYFPSMDKFISDYLNDCKCQRSKTPRLKPSGLLNPLPVPDRNWGTITTDLITGLPKSKGHDAIQVWVDARSKMVHFAPTSESLTAKGSAELFINNVFKLHGLPDVFISDRGPQWNSAFWKELSQILNIDRRLSTAYHPQTNGQTERTNQILEQYLRTYVSYQQTDWPDFLPLAEFTINNSVNSSTNLTPFYANHGQNPVFDPSYTNPGSHSLPAAAHFANHMHDIAEHLSQNLLAAKKRYKHHADNKRNPDPDWTPGTEVYLSTVNLKTRRPSKKLDDKRIGPFKIIRKIGNSSYELLLPTSMKIHNVFHVSLLSEARASQIPGRRTDPPPPVEIDNEIEYEVAAILDSKLQRKRLLFLVDWYGYGPSDRTWEKAENLENAQDAIMEFYRQHPNKPGASQFSTP